MFVSPSSQPRTTEDYQVRLKALEGVYRRQKDRLEGKDQEWNARKERLEAQAWREIKAFGADDSATKAVLIIGHLQAIAAELDAPRLAVMEYEELHRRYIKQAEREDKIPDTTTL